MKERSHACSGEGQAMQGVDVPAPPYLELHSQCVLEASSAPHEHSAGCTRTGAQLHTHVPLRFGVQLASSAFCHNINTNLFDLRPNS